MFDKLSMLHEFKQAESKGQDEIYQNYLKQKLNFNTLRKIKQNLL